MTNKTLTYILLVDVIGTCLHVGDWVTESILMSGCKTWTIQYMFFSSSAMVQIGTCVCIWVFYTVITKSYFFPEKTLFQPAKHY